MPFEKPVLSLPGRQRVSDNGRGGGGIIHLTAEETGGMIGMWESHPAPGSGPGWHTHTRETESFHVLEGHFRYWCGDDIYDVEAGGVIALPPHIPHQWKNVGDTPGHIIGIVSPGGFERFFLECGTPCTDPTKPPPPPAAPPDLATIAALFDKHGMDLPPPK